MRCFGWTWPLTGVLPWREPSAAPDPAVKLRAAPTAPAVVPMGHGPREGLRYPPEARDPSRTRSYRRLPLPSCQGWGHRCRLGLPAGTACVVARGSAVAPRPHRRRARIPVAPLGAAVPCCLPPVEEERERRAAARVGSVAPLSVVVERKGRGSSGRDEWKVRGRMA
ncbi:unnamed protein product [Urochloa humidicola]